MWQKHLAHPRILSDCNRLFEKLDDKMQDHFVECASRRHIRKKQRRFWQFEIFLDHTKSSEQFEQLKEEFLY